MADAYTTCRGLRSGAVEANPVRRFFIRSFGVASGTYGVAAAFSAIAVLVNVYSYQPLWALVTGNMIVAVVSGWAAWSNYRGGIR